MDDNQKTADALISIAVSPNCHDSNGEAANLVDGLYRIASALGGAARHLGKEDASSPMGAIEALGKSVEDGSSEIAGAINNLAEAVRIAGLPS